MRLIEARALTYHYLLATRVGTIMSRGKIHLEIHLSMQKIPGRDRAPLAKAWVKRRISYASNRMQISKRHCFRSFAFDWTHVKCTTYICRNLKALLR